MKMQDIKKRAGAFGVALALSLGVASVANAAETLKIGFVGVTSGPKAAWGISNVRCMQTRAKWVNDEGGIKIGDTTYNIEIVTWDTQDNTTRAREGMEKNGAAGHSLCHRSKHRPDCRSGAPSGRKRRRDVLFLMPFPKEFIFPAGFQRYFRNDCQLSVRPGNLQISATEQGCENHCFF